MKKDSTIKRMKKGAREGFERSIEVVKGRSSLPDAAKKVKRNMEKASKRGKR